MDQTYKVALVTGASRGIGKAITLQLQKNYDLAVAARNEDALNELTHRLKTDDPDKWGWINWDSTIEKEKQRAIAYPTDLSDQDAAKHLVEQVIADFGRLDVLINNAALYEKVTIEDADLTTWDTELDVNLRSVIHLCHYATPYLKKTKGAIINIGSVAGHRAYTGGANYCASKWGLLGFTKALFYDLRDHDIKVSCISPGYVNTAMNAAKPLNHAQLIQPEDIAETVRFILSFPANACPVEVTIQPQRTPK